MSLLFTVQSAIKAKLDADSYFTDAAAGTPKPIAVIIHRAGDIVQEVTEAVGKYLICVVIFPPSIQGPGDQPGMGFPAGPYPSTISVHLEVVENGILNRNDVGTAHPGDDVAERIVKVLTGWSPAPTLNVAHLHPVSLNTTTETPLVVHAVDFAARLNWKPT